MIAVPLLQVRATPIGAGDLAAAKRGTAGAVHPEIRVVSERRVVDGDFNACADVHTCDEHERVQPPQRRVAGVVSEMQGRTRR